MSDPLNKKKKTDFINKYINAEKAAITENITNRDTRKSVSNGSAVYFTKPELMKSRFWVQSYCGEHCDILKTWRM